MKRLILALLGIAMLSLLTACELDEDGKPRGDQVLWDRSGVPHIYAARADSLAYAFGRAQMQAHPELLLRLYAQGRGRGAEYYGAVFEAGEPFPSNMAEVDRMVRAMGFRSVPNNGCNSKARACAPTWTPSSPASTTRLPPAAV